MLMFLILMGGCKKHNPIDFSSSDSFFSSLNEKEVVKKVNQNSNSALNDLMKKNIRETEKKINNTFPTLSLSSYKKKLKNKIGFDEITVLKIFNNPNLKIKHGKIKNLQFHLEFCHLDLFFSQEDETYIFRHFDIRPSSMSSSLNEKNCVKDLNNNFILIRDPK